MNYGWTNVDKKGTYHGQMRTNLMVTITLKMVTNW